MRMMHGGIDGKALPFMAFGAWTLTLLQGKRNACLTWQSLHACKSTTFWAC